MTKSSADVAGKLSGSSEDMSSPWLYCMLYDSQLWSGSCDCVKSSENHGPGAGALWQTQVLSNQLVRLFLLLGIASVWGMLKWRVQKMLSICFLDKYCPWILKMVILREFRSTFLMEGVFLFCTMLLVFIFKDFSTICYCLSFAEPIVKSKTQTHEMAMFPISIGSRDGSSFCWLKILTTCSNKTFLEKVFYQVSLFPSAAMRWLWKVFVVCRRFWRTLCT